MAVRPQEYFQTQTFSAIPTPATADANKALAVNNTGTALVYTPLSGRKNLIINGNFDIWQRGTSQTANGYESVDRWRNDSSGVTKTASRQTFTLGQTDVPGNPKYWLRTVVTSVAGAGNRCNSYYRIESVLTGAGQTVTLSFWAKADASKNIAIEFTQSFGTGGTPSSSVTGIGAQKIALTTAWAKYTVTVAIPSITGKTLGTDGNDFLGMALYFDAGSDWDARTDTLGQQSGTFDIAQVQLEIGEEATAFEQRSYGEELALCQRYYQVHYGSSGGCVGYNYAAGARTLAFKGTVTFPVEMRVAPTATIGWINYDNCSEGTHAIYSHGITLRVNVPAAGWYRASDGDMTFDAEL